MTRYKCNLSPDLIEKANQELNEPKDDAERWQAIDRLKERYDTAKYGRLLRDDDGFILKFLRAKKFNQEKALTVLQNYHSIRREMPKVFDKVNNPTTLQSIVKKGVLIMLDGRATDGSSLSVYRPGLLGKQHNLYDLMAYCVISLEKLLEDEANQVCGVSAVEDLSNFNVSLFLQVSPFELAKLNSIFQDAMPIRFKGIYVVNEGKIFDILVTMFKPFLKKKLLNRFHPLGNNYAKLLEFMESGLLPSCYGGTGPDLDKMLLAWFEKLSEDWPQDTAL